MPSGRGAPGRESGATGEHATRARPKRDRSVSPVFVVARRAAHPAGAARERAERWQTKLDGGPGRRSRSAGEVGAGRRLEGAHKPRQCGWYPPTAVGHVDVKI